MKYTKLLINLSLLLLVIIIFWVTAEITTRILEPKARYEFNNTFQYFEYDSLLGWKQRTNTSGVSYVVDSAFYLEINSKSIRDVESNYSKPNDTIRIEFFGDSFTWGSGVNWSQRYTTIFGNEINKGSKKYEIINFGLCGYGTDQEYLLLKTEGIKYEPDFVVFAYDNDLADVAFDRAFTYPKPFFILENNTLKNINNPVPIRKDWKSLNIDEENTLIKINRFLSYSSFFVFLRNKLINIDLLRNYLHTHYGYFRYYYPDINKTFEVIDTLLLESKKIVEDNNATFIIVLIPGKTQVYGIGDTLEIDHLINFGKANNITVINLLPGLKQSKNKKLYFDIDCHFSIEGNKIAGELLAKEFGKLSGIPVLINTCFNVRKEPIVCTPYDSYFTKNMEVIQNG